MAKNRAFRTKNSLPYPLLCDPEGKMIEAFGALKPDRSAAKRTTFLVGPDGKVLKIWEKVKIAGHAKEVAEAIPKEAGKGATDSPPSAPSP